MRPRRVAAITVAWGAALALIGALGYALGERDAVALSELPAAFAGTLVLAGGLLLLRERDALDVPDTSVGAATLGAGLVLAGAGAAVGLWLVFLAAPVVVLGLFALVLERRG